MLQTTINLKEFLIEIDPLNTGKRAGQFNTISDLISVLLNYVYPLAGLILFIFLIIGGFSMLTSAGDPEKIKAGQGKITSALIGFLIIFVSYWIIKILQVILGMGSVF